MFTHMDNLPVSLRGLNPTSATWDPYQEGARSYKAINDTLEMRTLPLEQEERDELVTQSLNSYKNYNLAS